MPTAPKYFRPPGRQSSDKERRRYDRERDQTEARQWYKTARWQRRRKLQLDAEPICRFCHRAGRLTIASVADHIEPHRGDYDKFWFGELQSLCDEEPWRCHSSVKQREESAEGSRR